MAVGGGPVTAVRLSRKLSKAVDSWAAEANGKPDRSEAVCRLVELGLTVASGRAASNDQRSRAATLAESQIDRMEEIGASAEDQASRKRQLTKGPKEFRESRVDRSRTKEKRAASDQPLPSIYILEVGGKPTVAFEAHGLREASEVARERWLLDELRQLRSHGAPVWDGKAAVRPRIATLPEVSIYREVAVSVAKLSGNMALVYLVELDGRRDKPVSPGGWPPRGH
jgi:hypothetical protein